MRRKSFLGTLLFTISLLLSACGNASSKKSNNLELLYFGKPKGDVQIQNRLVKLPNRLNEENDEKNYEIEFGGGIDLEAHVKNVDRLAFLDIVVYSASTGKKYVFNDGNGDYRVESSTVLSNNVWTTKLRFSWIDWQLIEKSTDSCCFDSYLEIEEINFLNISGSVAQTNIAQSDVRRVNIHAVDGNPESHTWTEWEYKPLSCEDYEGKYRHCTVCGRKESEVDWNIVPLGHTCKEWEWDLQTPGVIQKGDKLIGKTECSRCHQIPVITLPSIKTQMNLVIPNTITIIGEQAFYESTGLLSVRIPSSVTSIGYQAFGWCNGLMNVYFESEVPPHIGGDVFAGTWDPEEFKIHVPCTSVDAYKRITADCWRDSAVNRIVSHVPGEMNVIQEPTCTEAGIAQSKCMFCEEVLNESIPALGHECEKWDVAVPPTCEMNGIKTSTCTRCGQSVTSEVYAIGHQWVYEDEYIEPTCDNYGGHYRMHCSVCGRREDGDIDYNKPPLGHTVDGWTINARTPGIIQQGDSIMGECSRCNHIVSEQLPNINSSISFEIPSNITSIAERAFEGANGLVSVTIPDSVVSIGNNAFGICDNLLSVYFESEVPPQIGRDLFSGTWNRDTFKIYVPEDSVELYKAVTADYWQDYAVSHITGYKPASSHEHIASSTWSSDSASHWHACTFDGCKRRLDASPHSWDSGVVVVEPTEEEDGLREFTCTVCGYKKTETINRLGMIQWDSDGLKANMTRTVIEIDFGDGVKGYKSKDLGLSLDFNSKESKTAALLLLISIKVSNIARTGFWYQDGVTKTQISINDTPINPPATDIDFTQLDCNNPSPIAKDNNSPLSIPVWIDIARINIVKGSNTLTINNTNASYSYFICGIAIN